MFMCSFNEHLLLYGIFVQLTCDLLLRWCCLFPRVLYTCTDVYNCTGVTLVLMLYRCYVHMYKTLYTLVQMLYTHVLLHMYMPTHVNLITRSAVKHSLNQRRRKLCIVEQLLCIPIQDVVST